MMYPAALINRFVSFIRSHDGIADKNRLATAVKNAFSLKQNRSVFYCDDLAVRFCQSESKRMSNTVLSLSTLQKYDDRPFIVCIVSSKTNYLLLANSTFLKKISHSSKELRVDHIRGSFNGGDIMMKYNVIENSPPNFDRLFAFHAGLTFQDNLERLVDSTNDIVGRVPKFNVTKQIRSRILDSVQRAQLFISSPEYQDLKNDLDNRVSMVQREITTAADIKNVNIRGRTIEYLITDTDSDLKAKLIDALNNKTPLPAFKTDDGLGDYSKEYPQYCTQTDIKTKVLSLDGNPKAYNIDKLLEFLATQKSVYMIYLLGVDETGRIVTRLYSSFDKRIITATTIRHHWAGRNTRGVAQFLEPALKDILDSPNHSVIDVGLASSFLDKLIAL